MKYSVVWVCALCFVACSSDGDAADSDAADVQETEEVSGVDIDEDAKPSSDAEVEQPGDLPDEPDVEDPPDLPDEPDVPVAPKEHCEGLGLPKAELITEGEFGIYRHNLADDFQFYPLEGDPWVMSEHWTGCDVYLFITNSRPNSSLDPSSIWERDIDTLLAMSPKNVHFFFMAAKSASKAMDDLNAMQGRVDEALAALPADEAEFWTERVHVAGAHFSKFPGWLKLVLSGPAYHYGFAIDRGQKIRLLGSYADVTRFNQALKAADKWPWEANMGYAAHDVRQYNFEALRDAKLAAEKDAVTVVTPWTGVVLKHVVETETEFPDADAMSGFDTLEIDLTMDCPDPKKGEFGNCGAWDYLSHIYMQDLEDEEKWIEVARFITTYHREGRYLVDASHMLPYLKAGGTRTLKYDISPSWNPQAYLTHMEFRFSNRGKGYLPKETHFLWPGANFNPVYSDNFKPIEVAIPATATRVELRAIITGHGMDTQNCAEFCNHQHFFTVGAKTHAKKHPESSLQQGCIGQIENGMVPNQGGTWWFGRGGWCPGQQVDPWVVDVTADVTPGETVTLSYEGKLNGSTPPDNAGKIRMNSWLVIYE